MKNISSGVFLGGVWRNRAHNSNSNISDTDSETESDLNVLAANDTADKFSININDVLNELN